MFENIWNLEKFFLFWLPFVIGCWESIFSLFFIQNTVYLGEFRYWPKKAANRRGTQQRWILKNPPALNTFSVGLYIS